MSERPFITCLPLLLALSAFLGAIGTLAFSPFDLFPCALISLVGLLLLSYKHRYSAWVGFCWGLGLFASGIYWIYVSIHEFGNVIPPLSILLVCLLIVYLSLYPALFSYLLNRFFRKNTTVMLLLAAPVLWQITEFLRGTILSGFPWLEFSYSQINSPLKFLAPIIGAEGINLILLIIAGLIALTITQKRFFPLLCAIILFFAPYSLKYVHWVSETPRKGQTFTLVQGNIKQSLKWNYNFLERTIEKYVTLSLPLFHKDNIVIWPEASIPDIESYQTEMLYQLDKVAKKNQSNLILGILRQDKQNIYNSVIALGRSLPPYRFPASTHYDKHHLVPFGEYTPLANIFQPISKILNLPMSNMARGNYIQPQMNIDGIVLLNAICYEIAFAQQMKDNFKENTNYLLTVSNDGWFGDSIGPWQHLQMARMRALELGRPLIRATNNGITAFINAQGDIIKTLPQSSSGVLTETLPIMSGITPFSLWGDYLSWIITLCMFIPACFTISYRKKNATSK